MKALSSMPWRNCMATAGIIAMLVACGGGGDEEENGTSGSTSSTGNSSSSTAATGTLSYSPSVTGWAAVGGTTGGAGAPAANVYVVHNRQELLDALANKNSASYATSTTTAAAESKIIYVVGTIYGTDLGDGTFADLAYYKSENSTAANWDWDLYIQSLDTDFSTELAEKVAQGDADATATKTAISKLSSARTTINRLQKAQIELTVPSNTSIIGVGGDARLIDGYLSINASSNIIVRNLEIQAPQDLVTQYDTEDEEWNAKYDAISVVTGTNLWFDHLTLSDGSHLDSEEILTINGTTLPVQRHDGLLDIEDSSDYVTVSYCIFKDHDKTNMVGGSGDQNYAKERDYNHLTFNNNIWENTTQRAPRARFGKIHVYSNYYSGDTDSSTYPMDYYIGMGAESKILSEGNVFDLTGSEASVSRVISNLNGYQFKDNGSWYNGASASTELIAAAKAAFEARESSIASAAASKGFSYGDFTTELGWTPDYSYTLGSTAEEVREFNTTYSGSGQLPATSASGTRPMLSATQAETFTVANALAGSDSWAPQSVNSDTPQVGHLNTASFTADYVVAADGTGSYTSIQAAINAAVAAGSSRAYIQVKAGTYTEQLVIPSSTTAITLYSTEDDPGDVIVTSNLAQVSTASDYLALVGSTADSSIYTGNSDALTVYAACARKTGSIGKECSTTMRIRGDGFQVINMSFVNAWGDTDASNNQALAAMVDKADEVIFDNVSLTSNQDTLYLSNSGKRVYFAGGRITGDVDFIFGPGVGVFDGTTIYYTGTRKASGGYNAAPSTLNTQTYGFLFNRCVFIADDSTTDDSVYLARQWDDDTTSVGKMIVRNSFIGKHIALTNGPWNATTVNKAATTYASNGEPYLAEYANWDETQQSSGSASGSSSSATSASSSSASSASSSSSSIEVTVGTGSDTAIEGSSTITNSYVSSGLATTVGTTYDATNGIYTLVSAGSIGTTTVLTDTLQFDYVPITGDFTMIACLTSLEVPDGLSTANVRAGIQIRGGTADDSRYYGVVVRGSVKGQWEQRLNDGEKVSSSTLSGFTLDYLPPTTPVWLKLQRSGDVITVSASTDAVNYYPTDGKSQTFTTANSATPFPDTAFVGLYAVSGSTTVTSTSIFDSVTITMDTSTAE